jgi:protein-histidine N-methyltransferase
MSKTNRPKGIAAASDTQSVDGAEGDRKKFYHETVLAVDKDQTDEEQDRFDIFLLWLKEHGALFPGQYLKKYDENVRGVHASRAIAPDSQISTIPLNLLIHEGMGQGTDVGRRVHAAEHEIIVPNHTQVIIYLLETGARYWAPKPGRKPCTSFFKPYYDILPRTFESFPIFWSEEELSWLEGSALSQQIKERKENILFDYYEVCRICPDFGERFNEDDFLWCRTAVGSRNFGITVNGVKRTTMVPWADMLNHFRPRETSWTFSNEQQAFIMTSLGELKKGQQIMDSYGKKCNSKFFMHYGFAVENNRESDGRCMNAVLVGAELLPAAVDEYFFEQRMQLVHAPEIAVRITMNHDDAGTAEMLSFCRVAVADQEELEEIFNRGHAHYPIAEHPVEPVSPRNEVASLAFLARECRSILCEYPTSLKEDLDMLENGNIPPFSNRRNALIVVKSEKEVLWHYIRLCELVAPLLAKSPNAKDLLAHVNKNHEDDTDDIDRYMQHMAHKLEQIDSTNVTEDY